MSASDYIVLDRGSDTWSHTNYKIQYVPNVDGAVPLKEFTEMTCDLARICGYLVANGDLNITQGKKYFSFCTQNKRVQLDFESLMLKVFQRVGKFDNQKTPTYTVGSTSIRDFLQQIGLHFVKSNRKEIPFSILRSGKEIVTAFLEAYFSCGSCYSSNDIELMSVSKKLANQLHVLLLNYGIAGSLRLKMGYARNTKARVRRPYYRIIIMGESYNKFLTEFSVLKFVGERNDFSLTSLDSVPHLGRHVRDAFFRHHTSSGFYMVGDEKKRLTPIFVWPTKKKLCAGSLEDNLRTVHLKHLNLDTLNVLGEHELIRKIEAIKHYNFLYEQVASVKVNKHRHGVKVFDISVPKGHNFIANGIVSHNTMSALYIGITYGRRMLVIAHQKEFLDQFEDHVRDFSNLPDLEKKHKVKLFGRAKTYEEFRDYQIATATVQTFYSEKGRQLLRRVNKFYGMVWADECFTHDHRVMTDIGLVSNWRHCHTKSNSVKGVEFQS